MELYTVGSDSVTEFTEKRSVFTGYSFFVRSEEEACAVIEKVRRNSHFSHCVYAYSLHENGIQRFSDGGEPQGTAGMPVLKVINFNSLTDTCIVVTRFFGGILLGAGGLVRAYTRAAADTVAASGKTAVTEAVYFSVSCGYGYVHAVNTLLDEFGAEITAAAYSDKVEISAYIPVKDYNGFKSACSDKLYSNAVLKDLKTAYIRK